MQNQKEARALKIPRKDISELSRKGAKTRRYRDRHPGVHARQNRDWYAKSASNAAKANKATRAWQAAHTKEIKAWYAAWYIDNGEQHRKAGLKRHISKLEKLAGCKKPKRCYVCNGNKRISFDHCHRSGKFRGWLCFHCNVILGHARDSKVRLQKLIDYLERGGGRTASTAKKGKK